MVHRSGLRVKTNGGFSTVNLSVSSVTANLTVGSVSTMFMVVLEAAATQLEVSTDFSGSFSGNLSSGYSFAIYNASRSANTGAQIATLEKGFGR